VHLLVLEDRENGFGAIEERVACLIDVGVCHRVDDATIDFVDEGANLTP
jgi:hypothetical protein